MAPKSWYLIKFLDVWVYHRESLGICMEILLNTELGAPYVVGKLVRPNVYWNFSLDWFYIALKSYGPLKVFGACRHSKQNLSHNLSSYIRLAQFRDHLTKFWSNPSFG